MKARTLVAVAAVWCMGSMGVAPMALAQDAGKGPAKGADAAQPGGAPDMEAMMKAWEQAASPGEMHTMLASRVGEWEFVSEWINPMNPGQMEKSNGTAVTRAIYGGRYFVSEAKGEMMGMPFEGMEITGYNNVSKRFESVWLDSMGTALTTSTGTWDEKTQQLTFTGTMDDPMTGKSEKMRNVVTIKNNDSHVFEMFGMHEGKEMKMMTITYTRKGSGKPGADKGAGDKAAEAMKKAADKAADAAKGAADKAKDAVKPR